MQKQINLVRLSVGLLILLLMVAGCTAPATDTQPAESEGTTTEATAEPAEEAAAEDMSDGMMRETGAIVSMQAVGDVVVHSYLAPVQAFANNTHIIETPNSLILFDTQFLLPNAMDFRAYADSLGKPIERVIITHDHPDHFLGSEAFADLDVYALADVAAAIEAKGQAEVDEKQGQFGDMIASTFVVPMVLEPGTIEIDDVTVEFAMVANAEAEVQLVTKFPEYGIISVGDIVYSGVHLIMAGAPPTWIEALESLKAESDAYPIVLPGHGAATDPSVYDVNIAWLSKASELMETATTADEFKTGLMKAFPELGLDGAIDFVTPMLFPADDAGAMESDTPSEELSNAEKVVALLNSLTTGDITVAEAYVGEGYIQHNIGMPSGRDAFIGLVGQLAGMNLPIDVVRVIEDGDYVAAHTDAGMSALVDVYRFEDGLIVEHWDNVQDVTGPNPSGHTMFDGATEITDLDKTEENRAMIIQMLDEVLIQGNSDNIANYISAETYIQHNPGVADGLDGFGAAMAEFAAQGIFMEYHTVHHVMAQGNFVLSISEGTFGGEPTSFYDIFRIEDGLVVEHWDVIEAILPEDQWQNENGKFNFPGGPVIGNAESGAAATANLTIKNTIQGAFTDNAEAPYGNDTTMPLTMDQAVIFDDEVTGFVYDIEVVDGVIRMSWVSNENNDKLARVIEAGTFDRYYIEVDAPIIVDASANPDATLVPIVTVESPTLVVVEVGEGMEVGPGFDAQINIMTESSAGDSGAMESSEGAATMGLIEVITVSLADGASIEDFLPVNEAMKENYVSQQPGFLSRETAVSEDGQIRVSVHWESKADSDNSIAGFGEAPGVEEFMAPLNQETMVIKQYAIRSGTDMVEFPGSGATEVITLSLNEGADVDSFVAASEAMREGYVSQVPGFIARHTAVTEDGEWAIIVHWEDASNVAVSMEGFGSAPGVGEFMSHFNPEAMVLNVYNNTAK